MTYSIHSTNVNDYRVKAACRIKGDYSTALSSSSTRQLYGQRVTRRVCVGRLTQNPIYTNLFILFILENLLVTFLDFCLQNSRSYILES